MGEQYNHKDIEKKWQEKWAEQKLHETPDKTAGKENYYILTEFPYPSGNLHVGHWYAFSIPDMYARYKSMQGFNVLFPFGFDAFGLPAENAALKRNRNPREWTYYNIDYMKGQLASMGARFDWSRALASCYPDYYRWTQWMFLQFFKKDLAYQAETNVNWCPSCKTVLANEQVAQGQCERCDSDVEQRLMKQWMMGITKYADRLVDDLDQLDWPEPIKTAQKNWVGRSEGSKLKFAIKSKDLEKEVEVFTTRADTLFGCTYLVLAPEHELVQEMQDSLENWKSVEEYIVATNKKTELDRQASKEKTGVQLEGVTAINPVNGEDIPVWIADYVLAGYGTGAIMAVPAHDERDFEFAKKYDLSIREVVLPEFGEPHPEAQRRDGGCGVIFDPESQRYAFYTSAVCEGRPGLFGGGVDEGEDMMDGVRREVIEESGFHNFKHQERAAVAYAHYYNPRKDLHRVTRSETHLFILSSTDRQEQVLGDHEDFEVAWFDPKEALKIWRNHIEHGYGHWIYGMQKAVVRAIELGYDTTYKKEDFEQGIVTEKGILENSGEFDGLSSEEAAQKITEHVGGEMATTYRLRDWTVSRQRYWGTPIPIIHCRECGAVPVPDDQLPVELPDVEDYQPREDGKSPLAKLDDWVHVPCPTCGGDAQRETDTLDTFVDSSWYFLRYLDPQNTEKFANKDTLANFMPVDIYFGGAEHVTMHLLYSRFWQKALHDLGLVSEKEPYKRRLNRSMVLGPDGKKMSKSKGNVIDPDEVVERLGADTVRMYLAFMGPYGVVSHYPWDPNGVVGVRRFLERVWRISQKLDESSKEAVVAALHKMIKNMGEDIEEFKFNTAIAEMMSFINLAEKEGIDVESFKIFLRLLASFAPHMTEELWYGLGNSESIHLESWPEYDPELAQDDTAVIGVQVNGKVRDEIELGIQVSEDEAREAVLALAKIQKAVGDQEIKKFIYIPGKIISIVV